jgi:hypothetical protein
MRYRLRTLLIVLAIGPLALACAWWWCLQSTQPRAKVIPIQSCKAEEVATLLRQLYVGRIASETGGGRQQQQLSPQDFFQALRGGGRGGGRNNQPSRGEEQKMTLAVDVASNSLFVAAPDYLFNEVAEIVALIDSKQVVPNGTLRVVRLKPASGDLPMSGMLPWADASTLSNDQ